MHISIYLTFYSMQGFRQKYWFVAVFLELWEYFTVRAMQTLLIIIDCTGCKAPITSRWDILDFWLISSASNSLDILVDADGGYGSPLSIKWIVMILKLLLVFKSPHHIHERVSNSIRLAKQIMGILEPFWVYCYRFGAQTQHSISLNRAFSIKCKFDDINVFWLCLFASIC
jgi:hypothetical protein